MTKIKICGITRWEDASYAVALGVDALGFVFYPKSPRYVGPREAREIIRRLPPFVTSVGVFVDAPAQEIMEIANHCGLSAVQLHGRETPDFCNQFSAQVIKAFRVEGDQLPQEISHYSVNAILLDTYQAGLPGGTGTTFSWKVAIEAKVYGKIILAGGLSSENIIKAIETVNPYAVDVSSSVEEGPGIKDARLMSDFMDKVKKASPGPE